MTMTMTMVFLRRDVTSFSASWRFFWRCILLLSFRQNAAIVQARTILVTGGAGFVGSHLTDALLERGDDVVVVDEVNDYYDVRIKEGNLRMLQTKYGDNRVTIYRGDICDTVFLDNVFQRHVFHDIAHMAARAGVRPSIIDPFLYVHSNIKATVELLDRAVLYNVSNFVFASSSSVYGGSTSTFFSELEQVDRPISPYAATKKACELFAYTYHRKFGMSTAALRFFTVYGPRGRPDMAVW
jgi:UDP-glucuronate 4-epimerase